MIQLNRFWIHFFIKALGKKKKSRIYSHSVVSVKPLLSGQKKMYKKKSCNPHNNTWKIVTISQKESNQQQHNNKKEAFMNKALVFFFYIYFFLERHYLHYSWMEHGFSYSWNDLELKSRMICFVWNVGRRSMTCL